ncbi:MULTISPECIES: 3-deoxy-manno-octulosonate-8-phosphatase KdsC [Salinivibrio]|uniref:3-deoxy-D-manno-octulosonate 8-phosphate phosphatase KdsC n=1 Tax=Salinivibrio kushneri TaxID=1908198 RepID=A0AB36K8P4_9GAMM|nr:MULTISPECIES: 3-deoxy-manno-octulosonate-8-phosphatase KdsC [Salinivibrio]ODP95581.1 3-deoxy-D-manno-octulosonate 8-phosphate phosphatase [Salinivibrio sp. BNH]OOE33823.1 3-deoxy-D-manno-octulosonate 8-phosphate phosphatase [Salinivibrio kushneri]OOE34639.1 3-deoxy-D-manno-octulosonate 8-phosphate phosphatase [Salinivibrio kushneri]OOE44989.1 3-deoxy-D-manno-octulosonate 8-phosphate phosphatase [Salinivibrio kushneri]OOE47046.1 3-deoxy-D-manno-octulosonate 8-phosphate phosphatase [Salinivib
MASTVIDTLYGPVAADVFQRAAAIKLLICDIDGVFSDGRVYMGNHGEELKAFHTRDGYGIKSIMNAGIEVAVITGRQSQIVANRMQALGVQHVYQGQSDKLSAYQDLCRHVDVLPAHTAYMGDDLIDWPVMEKVGLACCVADGHPLLKRRAHFVTQTGGGFGAVREVCDLMLEARGELDQHKGLSL